MKTDKLSRLFSALGKPANNQEAIKPKQDQPQVSAASVDAVKVRFSKETTVQPTDNASDPEKVARIKRQVQDGTYNVDSKKIASAFMNELGLV